jgi:hypothetical protein
MELPNVRKTHAMGEGLLLPVVTDNSYKKCLVNHTSKSSEKFHLTDSTVGRRISDISGDLCD